MNYENILIEYENSVATIILNRPNVMNALNSQMRAELTDAVTRYSKEARVVVLTGSGSAFCSGQDLGDGNSLQSVDLERTLRDEYEPLIRAIVNSPVPTVTALNGAAAGAGANLALAADIVIAKSSAYFVQAFSRIGLIPDVGGTYFLPRAMGLAKAIGSSIFADKIMAAEAHEIGLIYEYIEDDDYDIHLKSRVEYLANGPTVAFAGIKDAMRKSLTNTLDEQLELEAKLQKKCGNTRDFQEGVLAFHEKRDSKFEGR